jgi:hypothetical protein
MTISEQLHFSVLSAPIAAADRRALSQAWYSALYRASGQRPSSDARLPANQGRTPGVPGKGGRPAGAAARATLSRAAGVQTYAPQAAGADRRSPQLRLARQIESVVRRRGSNRAAATFVLDGTRARVRILVVAAGGSVRVIAICSKRVQDAVARALAQASYASAARGVVLNTSTREDERC